MSAHDTWAAVMSLQRYSDLRTIMRAAVDLRGDTDSVAALAVGLASLNPHVENNLYKSKDFVEKFETSDERNRLQQLDYRLVSLASR